MLTFTQLFEDSDLKKNIKKNWKDYAKKTGALLGGAALGYGAYSLGHSLYNDYHISQLKKDMRSDETKKKQRADSEKAIDQGYEKMGKELEHDKKHPTEWMVKKTIKDFPNNIEYAKWKAQQMKDKVTGEDK